MFRTHLSSSQQPTRPCRGAAGPATHAAHTGGPGDATVTLAKLALIAEMRDVDTSAHMLRVGQVSGLLALALTGDAVFAERVCRAAPFHDIGKVCIDDAILKKPGPLDAQEWVQMRRHPELGARLLHVPGDPLFAVAEDIARGHHEKFDGSGYPSGLAGDAIALSARIVAVADYFDALTMDRCYRAALPVEEVLESMKTLSGTHFDPRIVAKLLERIDTIIELGAEVDARAAAPHDGETDEDPFAPLFASRVLSAIPARVRGPGARAIPVRGAQDRRRDSWRSNRSTTQSMKTRTLALR